MLVTIYGEWGGRAIQHEPVTPSAVVLLHFMANPLLVRASKCFVSHLRKQSINSPCSPPNTSCKDAHAVEGCVQVQES
jgi:hypothetical protein